MCPHYMLSVINFCVNYAFTSSLLAVDLLFNSYGSEEPNFFPALVFHSEVYKKKYKKK